MAFVFVVERVGRGVADGAVAALFAAGTAPDAPGQAAARAAGARNFRAATAAGDFRAAPRARHPHRGAAENLLQPEREHGVNN